MIGILSGKCCRIGGRQIEHRDFILEKKKPAKGGNNSERQQVGVDWVGRIFGGNLEQEVWSGGHSSV